MNRRRSLLAAALLGGAWMLVAAPNHGLGQSAPSARGLLEGSLATLRSQEAIFFTATTHFLETGDVPTAGVESNVLVTYIRAGDRLDIRKHYSGTESGNNATRLREVWDGRRFFWIQQSDEILSINDQPMVQYSENLGKVRRFHLSSEAGSFLEGYFPHALGPARDAHARYIFEILIENPDVSLTIGSVNGVVSGFSCRVVDAVTPWGKFKFWIDEQGGFALRRSSVEIGPDDEYFGAPLSKEGYLSKRIEVSDVEIEWIEDVAFATVGVMTESTRLSEGGLKVVETATRRADIDFSPDLDELGAFAVDFREGTVIMNADNMTKQRWKDGQVVADAPDNIERAIEEHAEAVIAATGTEATRLAPNVILKRGQTAEVERPPKPGPAELAPESFAESNRARLLGLLGLGTLLAGVISYVLLGRG